MIIDKGYRQLRKGRISTSGQYYHITFVVRSGRPVFLDFKAARALIAILHHADIAPQCDCLAYVVMPDHIHWLFVLKKARYLH